MALSVRETYRLLRGAGFGADQAAVMTAVAIAESGLRPDAVGDRSLADATWGPSVGLFQVRTLRGQTGTGGVRDITTLTGDPRAQARAAFQISDGGRSFGPWTAYTTGAYRTHLARVRAEIGNEGAPSAPAPAGGRRVPDLTPGFDLPWEGAVPDLPFGGWADDARRLLLTGTALAAGVVLVVLGGWRGVQPAVQKVAQVGGDAATLAATRGGSAAAGKAAGKGPSKGAGS